jgi:hypothetical protein
MRKQFVRAMSKGMAQKRCLWASVIIKADGGFWCFEDANDAKIWLAQQ